MTVAVVLLGHGSRRGSHTDMGLQDVTQRLRQRMGPDIPVRMAGWEFTQPSLAEAVGDLVRQGARRVLVMPYFLFDGKHVLEEIPEEMERLRAAHPGVELRVTRTLDVDARIAQLAAERVRRALGNDSPGPDVGIVVVNRGSRRRYNPGDHLRQLTAMTAEVVGHGVRAHHAQAEYEHPTIEEAAEALAAAGARTLVVLPYILFPGKVLYDNILPAARRVQARFPALSVRMAVTLGVDDRMVDVAYERLREAGLPASALAT
ncbi:MAG: CbiX/SirB N-terminal domain-containing protein [Dehalococcoidia bacterium]|nr:CbiX/SirB N-terminal domain-containing protein [Dehalococcoidia bacterium]